MDEAHRLKNVKSRLFDDLAAVPRDFCLLLTGTPLQNSTEELWALLHFADPTSFGSREEFTMQFGQLQDAHQVADLHTVLRPFLLRRVKEVGSCKYVTFPLLRMIVCLLMLLPC